MSGAGRARGLQLAKTGVKDETGVQTPIPNLRVQFGRMREMLTPFAPQFEEKIKKQTEIVVRGPAHTWGMPRKYAANLAGVLAMMEFKFAAQAFRQTFGSKTRAKYGVKRMPGAQHQLRWL